MMPQKLRIQITNHRKYCSFFEIRVWGTLRSLISKLRFNVKIPHFNKYFSVRITVKLFQS